MRNNFFLASSNERFSCRLLTKLPKHLFSTLLASTLFIFSGCPFFQSPQPPSLQGYKVSSSQERDEFLSAFRARDNSLRSARGRYQVEISKSLRREHATQVFAFQRPSLLRIELFASSLNQLMLMLVAKEDLVEALDPKEGVLYRALPTPLSLFKLLGVPLVPEELELWLCGMALVSDLEHVEVLRNHKDGTYAIETSVNFGRILRARFAADLSQGLKLISLEFGRIASDKPFFFSEMTYESGEHIPARISFHLPDQGVEGELVRKTFTENPDELSPKLFQIPMTENMVVEAVTEDESLQLQ